MTDSVGAMSPDEWYAHIKAMAAAEFPFAGEDGTVVSTLSGSQNWALLGLQLRPVKHEPEDEWPVH